MSEQKCYHCGADCEDSSIQYEHKIFCCNGCKTVYEILNQNELNCYYDFEQSPGSIPTEIKGKYNFLDNEEIIESLIEFSDGDSTVVEFMIPSIHCSSCIWVLENLNKLNNGIKASIVNFPKKRVRITYKNKEVSLQQVVEILASIGYEPSINLSNDNKGKKVIDRTLIYQVAVAGFAFGNIMLMSLPEYFQLKGFWLDQYKPFFRWIMFFLSVPVVLYSAKDYIISAYKGLTHKILNIDVPISLGILVLFFRSTFEIILNIGQGYFDSLTGLVFFLLVGKIFQQRTYNYLSFERDYKSYFPIAVTKIDKLGDEISIPIKKVIKGDRLLIRNAELVPVDGILIKGNALIDYSFITGESLPVNKVSGDKIFAGGKQITGAIEMEVLKTVSQSYLTQLWSNDVFNKNYVRNIKSLTDKISKYFTFIILAIATFSGVYWYHINPTIAFNVVTAVLIIACPCALALSAPFAFGNMLRIFGNRKFYIKNADVIEQIARIDTIIFDKTGTITSTNNTEISYQGDQLSKKEYKYLKTILRASTHPLSRLLYKHIKGDVYTKQMVFTEVLGKGIIGKFEDKEIKIGAANFVGISTTDNNSTSVYVKLNNEIKGKYEFKNAYREGLTNVFKKLSNIFQVAIVSGDNETEKSSLEKILPVNVTYYFDQKPENKLDFIKGLHLKHKHVMMIGDGLNDAGALAQSDVGIVISEDINVFSPACDAILDAKKFKEIPSFIKLAKKTITIIKISFLLSFLYNFIGMYFAITSKLSPIIAAILMPLSSITIVVFVTIATNFVSRKK